MSMAVTEAGVEEREVVAEVLSRAGLGTLQSADRAEEPLTPGSSGRLWLWGLWPCRFWPQRRWCRSQSLCWQKEPQYRAILQPLQVSLALRPQFQQFSVDSSCSFMTRKASSAACRLTSAMVCSIRALSVAITSKAFCSASATAFWTSDMA